MPRLWLFNKPFQVMSQFSPEGDKQTLAAYIRQKGIYPAGRLDFDSEGLLLLTDDGILQARIANPRWKLPKTYWAQVEGDITEEALERLRQGVELNDGPTLPAEARCLEAPELWERHPPIRFRANIPTSWVELVIREGRNRQVRRMTAAVGFPTLRLVRVAIGDWQVDGLAPGESRALEIDWGRIPGGAPRSEETRASTRTSDQPPRHRSSSPQPSEARRSPTPSSRTERGSSGSPSGRRPPRKRPDGGQN